LSSQAQWTPTLGTSLALFALSVIATVIAKLLIWAGQISGVPPFSWPASERIDFGRYANYGAVTALISFILAIAFLVAFGVKNL
jgi:hypothetical protein